MENIKNLNTEVPMPDIQKLLRLCGAPAAAYRTAWKDGIDIEEPALWIEDFCRRYGAAREAAGYAHAIKVIKRLRDSHQTATGECQSDCDFVTAWDSAIDALRGEMKP